MSKKNNVISLNSNDLRLPERYGPGYPKSKSNPGGYVKSKTKNSLLTFTQTIARMKTEDEFGDDAPPYEDWISTLNDLIAQARKLVK